MANFYVVLPSATSYDKNSASDFRCPLARNITLDGEWEVGLSSFLYPPKSSFLDNLSVTFHIKRKVSHTFRIPSGYYKTIEMLLLQIHIHAMLKLTDPDVGGTEMNPVPKPGKPGAAWNKLALYYDKTLSKVVLKSHGKVPITRVTFSPVLDRILKFERPIENDTMGEIAEYGEVAPRLHEGAAMYIYTSAIENQFVGDVMAPLLRVVMPTDRGEHDFDNVHYVPVLSKCFDSILINIRTETGESYPFFGGNCVVKLHFRKMLP